ncbi:histamine H2 receptor-like [Ostrea edulis]|uniref:histamine H2 receptor-like n=1 Tax=Ostrea edulis TaxID=37623 RepID=UPI0024AFCFCC|nr:histamine H2 receptor-like [Ostrea edulis]
MKTQLLTNQLCNQSDQDQMISITANTVYTLKRTQINIIAQRCQISLSVTERTNWREQCDNTGTYTIMNSSNDSAHPEYVGRNEIENAFLALALGVVMLLSIFGNVAVIIAIFMTRTLREELSNRLIVNLAITDLSNGLLVMFSSLFSIIADSWNFGTGYCNLICAINYCLIITSMLTLCFISCDRFQAIAHPLHYLDKVKPKHIYMMIAYSWIQGIIFSVVPPALNWVEYDYWEAICAIQWHRERQQAMYYVVVAFIVCFFLPGFILILNYYRIIKQVKTKVSSPATTISAKSYSTSSKAIRSLLIVVIAYFVCMTPFSLTKLMKVLITQETLLNSQINSVASVVAFISSAVNPLIYGIFRKDFRRAYKRIFVTFKRGNRLHSLQTSLQDYSS